MTTQEVKDYLLDKIAKYKIPEFMEFVSSIPRNSSGKILKQKLKNKFCKQAAEATSTLQFYNFYEARRKKKGGLI
jgi:acyl-CoA synthetase (AMP-forming)/AMP-acid ligase II